MSSYTLTVKLVKYYGRIFNFEYHDDSTFLDLQEHLRSIGLYDKHPSILYMRLNGKTLSPDLKIKDIASPLDVNDSYVIV